MAWFRFGQGKRKVQHDPARQQALLQQVRSQFSARSGAPFPQQHDAVVQLLTGDDGLLAAAAIVREFADAAHAEILAQATELGRRSRQQIPVQRLNYRPLWQATQGHLRWNLFTLPHGLFPYVHVSAAATVIGAQAGRVVQVTAPQPLLAQLFEILDLVIDGWEFGGVRVDTDAVALANRLVLAAQQIREAMSSPPPLPPPVRELMRRNNSIDVHAASGGRVVGTFNPGKHLRESLLI